MGDQESYINSPFPQLLNLNSLEASFRQKSRIVQIFVEHIFLGHGLLVSCRRFDGTYAVQLIRAGLRLITTAKTCCIYIDLETMCLSRGFQVVHIIKLDRRSMLRADSRHCRLSYMELTCGGILVIYISFPPSSSVATIYHPPTFDNIDLFFVAMSHEEVVGRARK